MISGRFGLDFVLPMPMVRVSVHVPGVTLDFVAIDFLLDTGSVSTCLHPDDAKFGLGIDPAVLADASQWRNRRSLRSIGGTATYYVCDAFYLFHQDDGAVARQILSEIEIAQPSASNSRLPSLLGMDGLRHFRVSMDYVGQRLVLH